MRWRRPQPDPPSAELAALAATPSWMYEFELADGTRTGTLGSELMDIHRTRWRMLEPSVGEALAAATEKSAIDLACSEGWFGHRLLEAGATHVHGVDIREENVRRARMVAEHLGLDAIDFSVSDVHALDPSALGTHDVVLCLGLIYHLEDPIGALRIARALTRGVCVVESQLVEPHPPLRHGWGISDEYLEQPAAWAAYYEPDVLQTTNPIASHGGVVSLVPNLIALVEAMRAVGFARVEVLDAPADGNRQYTERHRAVVAGWA